MLLLSSDPAHSLGDVLDQKLDDGQRRVKTSAGRLFARELDARARFEALRARYRRSIETVFAALTRGSRFDLAFDRTVMEDLIELAPPGMDELFAILAVVEALLEKRGSQFDVVVLDTAPTGHTLRLLALPETALAWIHAMLAILLKYRELIGLGQLARDLARRSAGAQAPARAPARPGRARASWWSRGRRSCRCARPAAWCGRWRS